MMKKKFLKYFIPISVFVVFFTFYCNKIYCKQELPETTLIKAFNSSGAELLTSEVYFWGNLDEKYSSLNEMESFISSFCTDLGIGNNKTLSLRDGKNDFLEEMQIHSLISDGRILNVTFQINKNSGYQQKKIVSVYVTEDLKCSKLEGTTKTIVNVFKKYKINPNINSCLSGIYDGKLSTERSKDISSNILSVVSAKEVEGIHDNNLISVSAYSPFISSSDSINVNGKKINLNIAIRYNSYENRTYIWLATPVITTEY